MIGDPVLLKTCHKNDVNDIVFPANKNELFATAGVGDVRIWQTTTGKELRRIEVSIILGPTGSQKHMRLRCPISPAMPWLSPQTAIRLLRRGQMGAFGHICQFLAN